MKVRGSMGDGLLLSLLLGPLMFALAVPEGTFAKGPKSANKESKNKITICHKPGTPAEKTIKVSVNSLKGHLGHGDLKILCGAVNKARLNDSIKENVRAKVQKELNMP